MKANKIIEMSQEKSRQKVKLAMEEIQRMRNEGEKDYSFRIMQKNRLI